MDINKYAILFDLRSDIYSLEWSKSMPRQKKTTLCPLGGVGVGGRCMFWIWYYLLSGTKRFSEIQQLLPQASRQMLSLQLRELEQIGILHRQTYVQGPPRVEYSLTDLGRRFEPILRQSYAWLRWYCEQSDLKFAWPV